MKACMKGHIYWTQNYKGESVYKFSEYDRRNWPEDSRDGHVWIKEHTIEFDVPDNYDPRPAMVEALRAEKERVRKEFASKIKEMDERINSLLALEMA